MDGDLIPPIGEKLIKRSQDLHISSPLAWHLPQSSSPQYQPAQRAGHPGDRYRSALSIVPTFLVLGWFGYTLKSMTRLITQKPLGLFALIGIVLLLGLVVVPVLFTYTEQVNGAIARLFARFRGHDGDPTPPSAPEISPQEYSGFHNYQEQ